MRVTERLPTATGPVLTGSYTPARAREDYFRPIAAAAGPVVSMEGRSRLMFGSSNYLGLAHDPRVTKEAHRAIDGYGTAINGSRILNGTLDLHVQLERELADWFETESAIVFSSGYQTNLGALDALLGENDIAICDAMCHASIFDGVRLSRARLFPFRHNRVDRLADVLASRSRAGDDSSRLVAVDGIYSMEGDIADLGSIAGLCEAEATDLYVDEAHAVGVLGRRGVGACELHGVEDRVQIRTGTLSKALVSQGGFVVGSSDVIDFIRFNARAMLFTAAAPPAAVASALASVRFCQTAERRERAAEVLANAAYFCAGLRQLGYDVPTAEEVMTPIIRIAVGDSQRALAWWRSLYEAGVYVHAALYPAVPASRAMLRATVIYGHTREHIDRALGEFERLVETAPETAEFPDLQASTAR